MKEPRTFDDSSANASPTGPDAGAGRDGAYVFEPFVLDLARGALRRDGVDLRLRPKSFDVLRHLVVHAGHLVSREQLLDAVWGHRAVTDGALTQCLMDIRRALGDDDQTLVRTVPRRGYLFDAPVRRVDGPGLPIASAANAAAPADGVATAGGAASSAAVEPPASAPRRRLALLAALAAVALVAAMLGFERTPSAPDVAPTPPTPASVAVLPFADLSPGQDQAWFADGVAEEILNVLAQSPDLRVIARTSSFAVRGGGDDVPRIAARLGATHVLEGSVRRDGDRVRITAQLIEARDGTHLWSQSYDRTLEDTLAVQDDVARAVARALRSHLATGATHGTRNPRAHERHLRAQYFFNRRMRGDLGLAAQAWHEAVTLDPGFARAWVGLAGIDIVDETPGPKTLARARTLLLHALSLDPGLGAAHVRAAQLYFRSGEADRARAHLRIAGELAPNDPLYLTVQGGVQAWRGDFDGAVRFYRRAAEIDPLSATVHNNLAYFLLSAGKPAEAEAAVRRAADLRAVPVERQGAFVEALLLQGRLQEAASVLAGWPSGDARDQYLAMLETLPAHRDAAIAAAARLADGGGFSRRLRLAEVHGFLGRHDEALARMREAIEVVPIAAGDVPVEDDLLQMRKSPFLATARTHEEWPALDAAALQRLLDALPSPDSASR